VYPGGIVVPGGKSTPGGRITPGPIRPGNNPFGSLREICAGTSVFMSLIANARFAQDGYALKHFSVSPSIHGCFSSATIQPRLLRSIVPQKKAAAGHVLKEVRSE
jgi:hypothetical protein